MSRNDFGALLKTTGDYVHPNDAVKGKEYICVGCKNKVIVKKGEIRKHHFAHHVENNVCTYHNHPSESEIHKEAKYRFASIIGKMEIIINWKCSLCNESDSQTQYEIIKNESDDIIIEYPKNNNRYDIAIINNDDIKCVIEICFTNKTTTFRPEPWFEIDANDFLKAYSDIKNNKIILNCIRGKCRYCKKCFSNFEKLINNVPKLNKKFDIQDKPCIGCESKIYNPVCNKSICSPCLKINNKFVNDWLRNIKSKNRYKYIDDKIVDIVNEDDCIYVKWGPVDKSYIDSRNKCIWLLSIKGKQIYQSISTDKYYIGLNCRSDILNFNLNKCDVYLDNGSNIYKLLSNDQQIFYIESGIEKGYLVNKYSHDIFISDILGCEFDYVTNANEKITKIYTKKEYEIKQQKYEIMRQNNIIKNKNELDDYEIKRDCNSIRKLTNGSNVCDFLDRGYVWKSKFYFYGKTLNDYNNSIGVYPIIINEDGEDVIVTIRSHK